MAAPLRRLAGIKQALLPPRRPVSARAASATADAAAGAWSGEEAGRLVAVVLPSGATDRGVLRATTPPPVPSLLGTDNGASTAAVVVKLYSGAEVEVPSDAVRPLTVGELQERSPPAARTSGAFETWVGSGRVDSVLSELEVDPESVVGYPNQQPRQVHSGHYVRVDPSPLPHTRLVALGSVCSDVGLTEEVVCDDLVRLLSGDTTGLPVTPWATPYALSIFGNAIPAPDPFRTGNGYGDGRAVTIGEWSHPPHRPFELQLKGGGTTPFSRGADGRAVLRSSVREFVAQEAMHAYGIRTSRAVSLVASASEMVHRPWYPPGTTGRKREPSVMRPERCAIACRAAPSFVRVGHFELYARRVARGDADAARQLQQLVLHAVRREYPEVLATLARQEADDSNAEGEQAVGTPTLVAALLRAAKSRFVELATHWVSVGYVQGNMNSDNAAVGGHTLDYGPFGYVQQFHPVWNPWTGDQGAFGFLRQPRAVQTNLVSLARALMALIAATADPADREATIQRHAAELQHVVSTEWAAELDAAMHALWIRKLGLRTDAPGDDVKALWDDLVGEVSLAEVGSDCSPGLLELSRMDWTRFWRVLIDVARDGVDVPAETAARALADASYDPSTHTRRLPEWAAWLERWRRLVRESSDEAVAEMAQVSPLYVPREWLLERAYTAAELGDHQPLHEALRLLSDPYRADPDADAHARFSRLSPPEMLTKAGVAYFS